VEKEAAGGHFFVINFFYNDPSLGSVLKDILTLGISVMTLMSFPNSRMNQSGKYEERI
jgi:hypothetical protein